MQASSKDEANIDALYQLYKSLQDHFLNILK